MGLLEILCFLIFLEKSLGQEQIYVISAPQVFHVGASANIVIQVYGYTEAFDATVSIKSYPDKNISYSSSYVILSPENKFQNSAILTIQPKQLSGEQGSVSYVYLEVVSKHFSKSKKMPISYDNGYLFVHTDKPVYTPHQSVKVRVYSLNDDWKPAKRETVLTFIDPEGSEVDIVEEKDYTGIISFPDFKIPSHPIFGVWTIKAKYKEDFSTVGATYFEIKNDGGIAEEAEVPGIKYVLSPYKLNLVASPLFLKPGIPYPIKVQVKDSLDQLVGGVPVILNAQTINENEEKADLESQKSITRLNDGVASFVVNLPSGVKALEFDVKTVAPDLPEENQASRDYQAIAYSSLSQSYLYIDWTGNYKPLLVGEYLNITVTSKSPYIDKITQYNYLILSRGKIVHFGTREKVVDSSYQSMNIPVTQNMVPSARLLVYYIVPGEQTTELVSDSVCLNVEEKCDNQLQVRVSLDADAYSPGQTVCLNLATESESWVAVTSVDSAAYGVQGRSRKPMERVFQALEKSDLGCGAGGGRDNAEVFHQAGLTFLTNANAEDSQDYDETEIEILRPRKLLKQYILEQDELDKEIKPVSAANLQQRIQEQAAKYKHPVPKKCCYDGAHRNDEDTCEDRATRIVVGPACVRAFRECCIIANQYRAHTPHKPSLVLGHSNTERIRRQVDTVQPGVGLGSEIFGLSE